MSIYQNAPSDLRCVDALQPIINLLNGGNAGRINAVGINDGGAYALDVLNSGAGGGARLRGNSGGALRVLSSTVEVDGAATFNSTVQATRLISTIATGTAPLTVTSTTKVTNLNVDLLDGLDSTAFVLKSGDTMTGALTIAIAGGGSDQALILKHNSGTGQFSLGASNAADPSLVFKDNSGDQLMVVNPSGSTYALDVNSGNPATNAARFWGDILVTNDLGVTDIFARAICLTAVSFSGSEKLRVSGTSLMDGAVEISTGGLSVNGGAIIDTVSVDGSGTVFSLIGSSQTQSTVGGAGGASALPATPRGYIKIVVGATDRVFPYYDAS